MNLVLSQRCGPPQRTSEPPSKFAFVVAVAFGASEWLIPDGDRTDAAALAAAVGASVEPT